MTDLRSGAQSLAGALPAALLALWLCYHGQALDPFIWFDDNPSIHAQADLDLFHAVHEGRWLNYLWTLRPFPTGTVALTALYLGGIAIFAALYATVLFPGRQDRPLRLVLAAALAVYSPPSPITRSGPVRWRGHYSS